MVNPISVVWIKNLLPAGHCLTIRLDVLSDNNRMIRECLPEAAKERMPVQCQVLKYQELIAFGDSLPCQSATEHQISRSQGVSVASRQYHGQVLPSHASNVPISLVSSRQNFESVVSIVNLF